MRRVVAAVVLGLVPPAAAGTLTGRVEVLDKGGRKLTDVSDAVIYVEGARARPKPSRATMAMKGKAFTPRVLVVGVGTTVDFPNEDPILHNAFSVSGKNRFDLDLYRRPKSGSWTFQHPGVARVYCNIHPQMSAVVLVRDNPFFTRAAPDGSFTLDGVPAGKYTLRAWHERGGEAAAEVTVPAEGAARGKARCARPSVRPPSRAGAESPSTSTSGVSAGSRSRCPSSPPPARPRAGWWPCGA